MKKRPDYLGILILVTVVAGFFWMSHRLEDVRVALRESKTPKLEIVNTNQFTQLCSQLTRQWNASGYAFYLLQPKSPVKTHKEKASSSDNFDKLPIRVELTKMDYKSKLIKNKYLIGNSTDAEILLDNTDHEIKNFLLIPVYQHDVIVGELYLMYDKPVDTSSIQNKISEAQVLGQLFN